MSHPPSHDHPIVVAAAARSDRGPRAENQDHFLVADLGRLVGASAIATLGDERESWSQEFILGEAGALFLVADGMGGARAGRLASELAATWILEEMAQRWVKAGSRTPEHFARCMQDAVKGANARVHQLSLDNAECRGMGTTVTAVGLLDSFVYIAQVGDSRAYLVRQGHAVQLTRDQSLVQQLLDSGAITAEQAEQSRYRNVVLQAVGIAPEVGVELSYQRVRAGDLVLVCSDGLSGVVRPEEISGLATRASEPAQLCEELVGLATSKPSTDNITVVAAQVSGPGLERPGSSDTVGRQVLVLDPTG